MSGFVCLLCCKFLMLCAVQLRRLSLHSAVCTVMHAAAPLGWMLLLRARGINIEDYARLKVALVVTLTLLYSPRLIWLELAARSAELDGESRCDILNYSD